MISHACNAKTCHGRTAGYIQTKQQEEKNYQACMCACGPDTRCPRVCLSSSSSDERLPWLSSIIAPESGCRRIVAVLCRVPAQALVANVREAAPASARPRVVFSTYLAAAGRRGVPAHGCLGPVGARSSPPVALTGVLPRSWRGMVRGDGPVAVAVPVRCTGEGVGRLQEPHKEQVWWQLVDRFRRWRRCVARRWRGGSRRPPMWLRGRRATCRWRSGTSA